MNKQHSPLFTHMPHPHRPRNVNDIHKAEQSGFNTRIAVGMTKLLSAMPTFWLVAAFITAWILLQYTAFAFDPLPFPLLLTLLNLPQISMMIALGVGQGVLGRHQELQAEEQFQTTQKSYHEIEQIIAHLTAQDAELVKQTELLVQLQKKGREL